MHGTLYIVEGVHNTPVYVGKLVSDGERPNIHKILTQNIGCTVLNSQVTICTALELK